MCYGNTYKNKILNLLNKISPTRRWTILIWLISIGNNKKRKWKERSLFCNNAPSQREAEVLRNR